MLPSIETPDSTTLAEDITSPKPVPLPSTPTSTALQSGYNPSTSSLPTLGPVGVSLRSPPASLKPSLLAYEHSPASNSRSSRRLPRSNNLALPLPRQSRSASPLGRNREPRRRDVEKTTSSDCGDCEIIAPQGSTETAVLRPGARSTADLISDVRQSEPSPLSSSRHLVQWCDGQSGGPPNLLHRYSAGNSLIAGSTTTVSLSCTTRMGKKGVSLSRTSSGSERLMRMPPPPIVVPPPPVPEVPAHWRDSAVSNAASRDGSETASSRTSQASNHSNLSTLSNGSSICSYSSSIDLERAALARTLSATASIKSNKGVKDKKCRRFLGGRKTRDGALIGKPLISPPSLLHTDNMSVLPKLRNRDSLSAESMEGAQGFKSDAVCPKKKLRTGTWKSEKAKPELHKEENRKNGQDAPASKVRDTGPAIVAPTGAAARNATSQKAKKTRNFGLPWNKVDKCIPEGHDALVEGGFFTRTQLPPVKYTRLPVLAVSGPELEKAGADGGTGVRVSMQLQPIVWYEGKRKTVRMSLQMTPTEAEMTVEGEQQTVRSSWAPVGRFSWLAGEDEQLTYVNSPARTVTSPRRSPLKTPLDSVGEEVESEDGKEGAGGPDTSWQEICTKLNGVDEGADIRAVNASLEKAPPSPLTAPWMAKRRISSHENPEVASDELRTNMIDLDTNYEPGEEDPYLIRWTEGANADGKGFAHFLKQMARERKSPTSNLDVPEDQQPETATFELPSVPSNRVSVSIKRLTSSFAESSHLPWAEKMEGADDISPGELAKSAQSNNRLSWMLNNGASTTQKVKILAAFPRNDAGAENYLGIDDASSAVNANMELRILSTYNLPDQAQVLAVIAEEDEEQGTIPQASVETENADKAEEPDFGHCRSSWPKMKSSLGLLNMRMIGMAEVEESAISEEMSTSGTGPSCLDDDDDNASFGENTDDAKKRNAISDSHVLDRRSTETRKDPHLKIADIQPLRLQSVVAEGPNLSTSALSRYIPGPIRLASPRDVHRTNSIAGMGVWNDHDTSENAWQRSEKGLMEGILDFFSDMVSTSGTSNETQECETNQDEEMGLRWSDAPMLDDAFVRLHAVDDIFAEEIDPRKPPPLPPLPSLLPASSIVDEPPSWPSFGLESSSASLKSISGTRSVRSLSREASQRRPKPVAVHSPGIGTLLMKRGLF